MTTDDTLISGYVMDSASTQGRQQLHNLEVLFDRATTNFLDDLGVWPGARCLDVGSGGGSIARWLAGRVGLGGEVVAVDIDTEQLDVPSRIEVHRHDISDGLPTNGTFDFIHARFVLMHLAERERVLRTLVDALAPGGWLVLGETPDSGPRALAAPTAGDAEFADRLVRMAIEIVRQNSDVDWNWAYTAESRMAEAGLLGIRGFEHRPMITGGQAGGLLMSNYLRQITPLLVAGGVTEAELDRFYALMRDPRFRAWPFLRLVMTAGRKPIDSEVQR